MDMNMVMVMDIFQLGKYLFGKYIFADTLMISIQTNTHQIDTKQF